MTKTGYSANIIYCYSIALLARHKEDKIKTYIQDGFREIHAPEDLRRKVMNMNERKEKKSFAWVKKLAVAAAVVLTVFAGSNCVAYAMTGNTWVENLTTKLLVNCVEHEREFVGKVTEDGTVEYYGTFETPDGNSVAVLIANDHVSGDIPPVFSIDTDFTVPAGSAIVKEDGKVYWVDKDVKIDLTEELAEGEAEISYEREGVTYRYVITESPYVPGAYDYYLIEE